MDAPGKKLEPLAPAAPLGALEAPGILVEEDHLAVLADMAARIRPHLRELGLACRSEVARAALPALEVLASGEGWLREAEAFVDNLARRDGPGALARVREWAKGLAEVGVPFVGTVQMMRVGERHVLAFLFETYRQVASLRRAVAAFEAFEHAVTVVAAQAFAEAHEVTISHLREELGEARLRPDALWWAFLESARMIGLEELQPRLVAQRLFAEVGYPGTLERRGGKYVHTGPHVLVSRCSGSPASCLSAFLAEAKVERIAGEALEIEAVRLLPDHQCEVVLAPLLPRDPA